MYVKHEFHEKRKKKNFHLNDNIVSHSIVSHSLIVFYHSLYYFGDGIKRKGFFRFY